jgi:hypothetical protein
MFKVVFVVLTAQGAEVADHFAHWTLVELRARLLSNV